LDPELRRSGFGAGLGGSVAEAAVPGACTPLVRLGAGTGSGGGVAPLGDELGIVALLVELLGAVVAPLGDEVGIAALLVELRGAVVAPLGDDGGIVAVFGAAATPDEAATAMLADERGAVTPLGDDAGSASAILITGAGGESALGERVVLFGDSPLGEESAVATVTM
jgi:hypothetical protein